MYRFRVIDKDGRTFTRVDRRTAKRLYESGQGRVFAVSAALNPLSEWVHLAEVGNGYGAKYFEFESFEREILYYAGDRRGRVLWYVLT